MGSEKGGERGAGGVPRLVKGRCTELVAKGHNSQQALKVTNQVEYTSSHQRNGAQPEQAMNRQWESRTRVREQWNRKGGLLTLVVGARAALGRPGRPHPSLTDA
jgi:hypothetical protein